MRYVNGLRCWLVALGVITLLSSCAVYYKTSDIQGAFGKPFGEMDRAIRQAQGDHAQKQDAYRQLTTYASRDLAPYPALSSALTDLATNLQQLKTSRGQAAAYQAQLRTMIKGKKQIRSDGPEWEAFKRLRKDYEKEIAHFRERASTYSEKSNRFVDIARRHRIAKVKIADIRAKVDAYVADLSKKLPAAAINIERARGSLEIAALRGVDEKRLKDNSIVLNKLQATLSEIDKRQLQIEQTIKGFESEVDENVELWVGPGMQAHTVITDLQATGSEIAQLAAQYNNLVAQLKAEK